MRVRTRRHVVFALLGLMAVAAGVGVATAAASLDHACCERAASSDVAPEPTCDGFLPLSCCQAAALPGSESLPAPPAAALPSDAPIAPILDRRAPAGASNAAIPRASPHPLSVVLQV
jgi:hypothetical protein